MAVFNEFFNNLKGVLCGPNVDKFAGSIFAAGLIGFEVMAKRDFTTIYGLFIAGLNTCNSVEDIQDKCQKFTESLKTVGGPAIALGETIEDRLRNM